MMLFSNNTGQCSMQLQVGGKHGLKGYCTMRSWELETPRILLLKMPRSCEHLRMSCQRVMTGLDVLGVFQRCSRVER